MERSLVLVKPDAMERDLAGVIIGRLQSAGLKLIGLKILHMDNKLAEKHYAVHKGKSFFNDLVVYMTSGPIVAAAGERLNNIFGKGMNDACIFKIHEAFAQRLEDVCHGIVEHDFGK